MIAPEFADDLRKRPRRIPGQISRGFAFQVYPKFGRDGYGEVMYLVNECVRKLRPAGGRPDDDDGTPVPRVRIGIMSVEKENPLQVSDLQRTFLGRTGKLTYPIRAESVCFNT